MDIPLIPTVHDPADVADYLVDFRDLLGSLSIGSVAVSVDAAAAALGVAIGTGARAPSHADGVITFWLQTTNPTNTAFIAGIEAVITLQVITAGATTRTFERSVRIAVRQSDKPAVSALAPVSLAEAKLHLRIVDDEEDGLIYGLISAAADKIEQDTGHILRQRAEQVAFDGFDQRLPLWRGPVVSVTEIRYDDASGVEQLLAVDQYRLRQFAGASWIAPAAGVTWPATDSVVGSVRVTYQAGYATNDAVPASLRHAALLLIGHWYENREAVNVGNIVASLPLAYDSLIGAYRVRMVA